MVRHPAKKEHPSTLAQLASRTSAIMTFGVGAGVDPFVKVKSLFAVLIAETSSRRATKFTGEWIMRRIESRFSVQRRQLKVWFVRAKKVKNKGSISTFGQEKGKDGITWRVGEEGVE